MNKKKIGLAALVLMLFTTIFGFGNGPVAFYQMGFSGIIWYIAGAVLFFFPTSMMYAEYGASYKGVKGGLYSWMEKALGQRWAFIATFIGLASWVIWMVSSASKIWVAGSNMVFGEDKTGNLSLFGLDSNLTLGLLASAWIILLSFLVTRGIKAVSRVASWGGIAVMSMNVILVIGSIVVLFATGETAEPINGVSTFINSPNPDFQNPIGLISFALFAIFAYGGLEQSSGVMDSVKDPEKTYPKAVIIATIVIGVGYSLAIFLWGVTANYAADINIAGDKVNLGNVTYVLMNNLGVKFGDAIGLSAGASANIGSALSRFTGLGMMLAYAGSFFVLTYAPVKAFILGTPKKLWPKSLIKLNKADVPAGAIWMQAAIVVAFIIGVALTGGKGDSKGLFSILTNMANIAVTLPYVFLIFAFPLFKNLKDVPRPFVFYKNKIVWTIVSWAVLILVSIAIIMTVILPFRNGEAAAGIWTIAGPVLFGVIAWIFYEIGERRTAK